MWGPTRFNSWPFVFLIYVNDLSKVLQLVDLVLFADDTNLYVSHKDPNILLNTWNSELEN